MPWLLRATCVPRDVPGDGKNIAVELEKNRDREPVRWGAVLNLISRYQSEFAITLFLAFLAGQAADTLLSPLWSFLRNSIPRVSPYLEVALSQEDMIFLLAICLYLFIRKEWVDGGRLSRSDRLRAALLVALILTILPSVLSLLSVPIRDIGNWSLWGSVTGIGSALLAGVAGLMVVAWLVPLTLEKIGDGGSMVRAAARVAVRGATAAVLVAVISWVAGVVVLPSLLDHMGWESVRPSVIWLGRLLEPEEVPFVPYLIVDSLITWAQVGTSVFACTLGFCYGIRVAFGRHPLALPLKRWMRAAIALLVLALMFTLVWQVMYSMIRNRAVP